MVTGWLSKDKMTPATVMVADVSKECRDRFSRRGVHVVSNNNDVAHFADVVVIAVKVGWVATRGRWTLGFLCLRARTCSDDGGCCRGLCRCQPNVVPSVLREISPLIDSSKLVLSIAAGVSSAQMEEVCDRGVRGVLPTSCDCRVCHSTPIVSCRVG